MANPCTDISNIQQAEVFLRESEERFRQIFTDAPIGMAITVAGGTIRQVNPAFSRMVGYTAKELIGVNFEQFTYDDDLALEQPLVQQLSMGQIPSYQLEKRYVQKSGQIIWVHLTCGQIVYRESRVPFWLLMVEDITERKRVEQMKDEFISIVSHELQTPLTVMHGALQLLATGQLGTFNDQGQRMLAIATQNTYRLQGLVNQILALEQGTIGTVKLNLQACDLMALIQQTVQAMQTIAKQARVSLRPAVDSPAPLVWADPDRLAQIFMNLLDNGIKFSDPCGEVDLTVQGWVGDGPWCPLEGNLLPDLPLDRTVLVTVRNQGQGVPPDKLEVVFERFQQVDPSDSRQNPGLGLGLAICRQLITQHGGQIWLSSRSDLGNTVFFTLPLYDSIQQAVCGVEDAPYSGD